MKKFGIYTIDSAAFLGKTVLLRVDINEPIDPARGCVTDDTRIRGCVPTIRELRRRGAKIVLLAHQGSDIEYQNFCSLQPHKKPLEQLVGCEIRFLPDVCGPAAQAAICALQNGEVLLLDNVRFMSEEQTLFERHVQLSQEEQAKTLVVRTLAPLAAYYVCDAFAAAHRDQPTLCGFEQRLPSMMGRLFEREFEIISSLMESPARPCVFVLGGAKIADAFLMLQTVLGRSVADQILTGGLVANIFLAAAEVALGAASLGFLKKQGFETYIEQARALLAQFPGKIVLPLDLAFVRDGVRCEARTDALPQDAMLVDIGAATAQHYEACLQAAKTVFVNGPMGIFEQPETAVGTRAVWQALAKTKAYTVIGGGDSVTATNQYGLADQMDYICTGGGALIRFLSGEPLPVVRALKTAAEKFPLD